MTRSAIAWGVMRAIPNPKLPDLRALAEIAIEDAQVLLVCTDRDGRIQRFSGACTRLTGMSEADVQARPIWELFAYREERESLGRAFPEAVPRDFVAHWADATADVRVLIWTSRTIRSSEGEVLRVVFTGVDVTERERTEATLRETGARHELLLDQLPAILWTTDRSLRFTSGVGAALERLGLRPGQIVGVSLFTYFGTDRTDDPNIAPSIRALEGETVTFDAAWMGRVFQVVTKPLKEASGAIIGTIGLALDVSERVEAERERDQLLAAERAARAEVEGALEVRDEFLSIASHELSTPLTALQLAVDSLAASQVQGPEGNRLALLASRQTARLHKLVNELLDVSRARARRLVLAPAKIDLAAAVRDVVARLGPVLGEKHVDLEIVAPCPVWGTWDRSRVEQIIANLIENALRHAPGAPIVVSVRLEGDTAVLEVSDRGPGIPSDRLAHIFDRFERATSAKHHGGLGLGLYIVQKLAEAHGGDVSVESVLGAGATFRVRLPRDGPSAPAIDSAAE